MLTEWKSHLCPAYVITELYVDRVKITLVISLLTDWAICWQSENHTCVQLTYWLSYMLTEWRSHLCPAYLLAELYIDKEPLTLFMSSLCIDWDHQLVSQLRKLKYPDKTLTTRPSKRNVQKTENQAPTETWTRTPELVTDELYTIHRSQMVIAKDRHCLSLLMTEDRQELSF